MEQTGITAKVSEPAKKKKSASKTNDDSSDSSSSEDENFQHPTKSPRCLSFNEIPSFTLNRALFTFVERISFTILVYV